MRILAAWLCLTVLSCSPDYDVRHYQAISLDGQDSAYLTLKSTPEVFYGDYKITYKGGRLVEQGTVRGHIVGDSLIGKFDYLSRDNVKSIRPIALLKDGENLKLGKGNAGMFMGLHVYQSGSIYFDDSLFLFRPVQVN